MHPQIKGHASLPSAQQFGFIKHHLDLFMLILPDTNINPENYEHNIIQCIQLTIMDVTHY